MTGYLVFNKFLARSFFDHLVLNKVLVSSFLKANMHTSHLYFNAFLASTFLNANMHVSHLVFLWPLNSYWPCRHGFLFTQYTKKSKHQVLFIRTSFWKAWMAVTLLIKKFQDTSLHLHCLQKVISKKAKALHHHFFFRTASLIKNMKNFRWSKCWLVLW